MCGIAGILERNPSGAADRRAVRKMTHALQHRGPDGEGFYFDGPVGLGHRRLAIIDLATGEQPISNEDGSIRLIFNGEIYNYLELRRQLIGHHTFRTQSDTEVIVHLYEDLGERCVEQLNGMFSFALWDARRGRLFAARDHMGIKPLYWHLDRERFSFASEPKALLAAGLVEPQVNPQALQEYLAFQFCLGNKTLFKNIWQLEPGHYLVFRPFDDDAPRIVRYWDTDYQLDHHHTEDYFTEQLLSLLQDSARLQLRSDVPVGAHLSGGIDSSTVACLAAPAYGDSFHTFTGAFREGAQYDETPYAGVIANHIHSIHHEIWLDATECLDALPNLIYMMDEPAAGPGLLPQYFVSKYAREHVKVTLGGQGGDEIFGGYARYLIAYLEQTLKAAIYGTQDEGKYIVTWESIMPNLRLLANYRPLMQGFLRDGLFREMDERYFRLVSRIEDVETVITADVWDSETRSQLFAEFQTIFNHPDTKSYFNKMTNFDIKTLLPALLHVEDRASMSVSLESRVPLLDHRIVDLVTHMPPTFRFKGGDTKRTLRDAVKHLLPEAIFNRRDKMGFPVPLAEWLRGPRRAFVYDILLSARARERGIYRMDGIEQLLCTEQQFGRQLWGLVCLELWFHAFFDNQARSSADDLTELPLAVSQFEPAISA